MNSFEQAQKTFDEIKGFKHLTELDSYVAKKVGNSKIDRESFRNAIFVVSTFKSGNEFFQLSKLRTVLSESFHDVDGIINELINWGFMWRVLEHGELMAQYTPLKQTLQDISYQFELRNKS